MYDGVLAVGATEPELEPFKFLAIMIETFRRGDLEMCCSILAFVALSSGSISSDTFYYGGRLL